ncbi:histidine kinase [Streptomyces sp. SID13031]|uniref:sensor histidine kinase n=1 Tax=Streptomyces sp. SID13031 TaxID=2706046 RepID=UPI0013CCADCC|nr:histidine kinase [Streptomyces sp. SID13031]NEA30133.1 two-component sensor histidine kinase [Streptomyces sp. SID13031]
MTGGSEPTPRRRALAAGLGGLAVLEVLAGVVLAFATNWSFATALDSFLVTNGLMGLTFAICGAVIAWHRPANPIGWLFIADGIGHATTAAGAPLSQLLHDNAAPLGVQRLIATISNWSWPWSIALFLPLALLLFPNGRLLSPRWRPVAIGIVVTAPFFAVEMGTGPGALFEDGPAAYLQLPSYDALQPLWTATEIRGLIVYALAIASLVIRYRHATETGRHQLLWLLLATVVMILFMAPWALVTGTPIFVLLAIPLIPVAVAVAIVRHQLLDIRLVVSRALTWAMLSILAVGAYAALVAVTDSFISTRFGRSAVVTVLIALLIAPVLPRLQRLVDRAMYGDRRDPARVASLVGEELSSGVAGGILGVVEAVRSALRLPYVAVAADGLLLASAGVAGTVVPVELSYGGTTVGSLLVGLRSGESELSQTDRNVLTLVAVPLAVAVHATRLSSELQASRERLVAAREEERRRLRRDLHDGLGPTLTGVAFTADAAANLVSVDAARASELLGTLRRDTRAAIADVRRLVDDLRPPALDELGLVGALQQRADQLSWRADGASVSVQVSADGLPALPAALEVAAYRIATEALTNVVRHSRATNAVLTLRCGSELEVLVTDDGPPNGAWRPGVGLQAMRERAAELGGEFEAGPSPTGGRVHATFPMATP